MRQKMIYISIIIITIALSLCGCHSQQRLYLFGEEYDDSRINATLTSAVFTDRIVVDGEELVAPEDDIYLLANMEITVKNGNWSEISGFVLISDIQGSVVYDRNTTIRLNGYDLLDQDTAENQSIRLVFQLKDKEEAMSSYSLIVEYTDGGCSDAFCLWAWPNNQYQTN